FIAKLITPAWMLAVARRLKAHKIDFCIHGSGWESHADLQDAWQGPVESAEDFSRALSNASHLLDVWPSQSTHPARNVGVDVVPTWGDPVRLLRSSRLASKSKSSSNESLSIETIIRIVRGVPHMIQA
ncbi:MAG TPA: hypothetical protein PK402_07200, partial [Tepidisphaeraceae bacterium]|nr:hypothetical protein [Tepidisphaeraceae bacterium]